MRLIKPRIIGRISACDFAMCDFAMCGCETLASWQVHSTPMHFQGGEYLKGIFNTTQAYQTNYEITVSTLPFTSGSKKPTYQTTTRSE